MDEQDNPKTADTLFSPGKDLITPEQINQMVQGGLLLSGKEAQQQARLVAQSLDQHFKRFTEESTSLGPLMPDSSDNTVKAYQKIATQHGQIIIEALSPLRGENVDPLHNQFVVEFLREGFKLWTLSPTHRSKIEDTDGTPSKYYQRLYHSIGRTSGYYSLLQRDAVSKKSSLPHAHWSIEAYTPILGKAKLLIGADNKLMDLAGTFVVVPGQVHAIANPKGAMTLTYIEIIGDPTPIK